jgi:hypothetical protein
VKQFSKGERHASDALADHPHQMLIHRRVEPTAPGRPRRWPYWPYRQRSILLAIVLTLIIHRVGRLRSPAAGGDLRLRF